MENNKAILEKYADLAIQTGVNLQKGQTLRINAPIEGAEFTRIIAKKAYELGAKNVHVEWIDEDLHYLKMKHASMDVLENFPQWRVDQYESFAEEGAAALNIYSPNPELLKEIDPERIAAANKAAGMALKNYSKYVMNDKITWSIISIPTEAWAKKVYPNLNVEEAIEKLWEQIFKITRVDQEDPIKAWEKHNSTLRQAREFLNEKQYKKLVYQSPGTDLTIELPENHIWAGGASESEKGIVFNPNIPTEEVFTMPHKEGVNGKVSSTMPLNYGGNLIENFTLTFKDGKIVDFTAESGYDTLKLLLDSDEGATRLGELALVPHHSPISEIGTIFFNTLYDENASCHLALGKAYPTNIQGGEKMSDEELAKHGVNESIVHEDFMIGSPELNIDGVTEDGKTEAIFRDGNWAISFN